MKNMLMRYVTPCLVVAVGVGTFFLLDIAKPKPEKKLEQPRPLSVYVEPTERVRVALNVQAEGEVRAKVKVKLVAQIEGRISAVSPEFTEGGRVLPGVTLVEIENIDYQLALSAAEAQVAEAEVGMQEALATANVARKQLFNASTASDLALKKPQVAQAQARIKAAKSVLALAQLNLTRTRITLPFTGRIIDTKVDIGQFVTRGTLLGTAFSTDAVEVRLPLNDTQLASLNLPVGFIAQKEDEIFVDLSATLGGKTQHWQGRLQRLDAVIDPGTRSIFAQVDVKLPYSKNVSQYGMPLPVGLYVQATIAGREVDNVSVIPRPALRAGNNVYVVKNGRLEIRQVTVVHSSDENAVIGAGLVSNDSVVVSSIRNPIPGMLLGVMPNQEVNLIVGED
jgi:RND family efflux transporter MFP subunit